jgi:hypothetical protein
MLAKKSEVVNMCRALRVGYAESECNRGEVRRSHRSGGVDKCAEWADKRIGRDEACVLRDGYVLHGFEVLGGEGEGARAVVDDSSHERLGAGG